MEVLLSFCSAFGISVIIMPFIIRYAHRHDIVDQPNGRKVHKKPIPLLGGLGMLIAFIIPLSFFTNINIKITMIVLGLCSITLLGILDDIYDIRAGKKLIIQIGCFALTIFSGTRAQIGHIFIGNDLLANAFDILISFLWAIGIVNAINLMDGLDGLAGGVTLISGLGFLTIGLISNNNFIIVMSTLLVGSVLGFLLYNFNPAKVFMGDGGSTLLGFILAIISLSIPNYTYNKASIWLPIIILAVPIFETGVSILRRAIRKQDIFAADKEHMHHKLIDAGLSQKSTVITIYGLSLLSIVYGIIIYKNHLNVVGIISIIVLLLYGMVVSIKGLHIWETASQIGVSKEQKEESKVIDLQVYGEEYRRDAK